MRGEVICVGDELLSGRVRERNASYLAAKLWPLGISVGRVVVVGDEPGPIKEAISAALARSAFVVVTGGLGTTDDDITAAMAAEVFGLPMAESRRMVENLRIFLEERGRPLNDEVRKMAWLPEGAEILCADCAGFRLAGPGGAPVYFLPGVPAEMRRITDERLVPELGQLAGGDRPAVAQDELLVFGLPEPEVGRRISGISDGGLKVGYYPVFPEVQVVITARAGDQEQAQAVVAAAMAEAARRLDGYVVARGGSSLEEAVGAKLLEQGLTVALAESCTGGLIGHRLTSVSGSSGYFERGYVVYSNRAKQELLGVQPATLESFGAVSAETAAEMAAGAREHAGTDLAVAVTGIAGPTGGSEEKPVGTVYFGLAAPGGVRTGLRRFFGSRALVKAQTAETALDWLRRYLDDHAFVSGA